MEVIQMGLIDLYARNPFQHDIGEKVIGYNRFRAFQFVCGTIIDREHQGETNAYRIESEYGKRFSGTLFESAIEPYDEKLVLEEIRRTVGDEKTRVLTLKILYGFGTSVILLENEKEIFEQEIKGDGVDNVDTDDLLDSYIKLLTYLGFKPDLDRMFNDGDTLIALNFIKDIKGDD